MLNLHPYVWLPLLLFWSSLTVDAQCVYYQTHPMDVDAITAGDLSNLFLSTSATVPGVLFSVSLWVRPNIGLPTDVPHALPPFTAGLIGFSGDSGGGSIIWNGLDNSFQIQLGQSLLQLSNVGLVDQAWSHLVWTVDYWSGSTQFYVNGTLIPFVVPLRDLIAPNSLPPMDGTLIIGNLDSLYSSSHAFPGAIDDVALWSVALDQTGVSDLFTRVRPDQFNQQPIAYYSFDELSPGPITTDIADISLSGSTILISENPQPGVILSNLDAGVVLLPYVNAVPLSSNEIMLSKHIVQNWYDARALSSPTAESTNSAALDSLNDLIMSETSRATQSESELTQSIVSEVIRATASEQENRQSIESERLRLTNEVTNLQNALSNETTRAFQAELEIRFTLDNDRTRAQDAENSMLNGFDELTTKVDLSIDLINNTLRSDLTSAFNEEKNRSINADQENSLATMIESERARQSEAYLLNLISGLRLDIISLNQSISEVRTSSSAPRPYLFWTLSYPLRIAYPYGQSAGPNSTLQQILHFDLPLSPTVPNSIFAYNSTTGILSISTPGNYRLDGMVHLIVDAPPVNPTPTQLGKPVLPPCFNFSSLPVCGIRSSISATFISAPLSSSSAIWFSARFTLQPNIFLPEQSNDRGNHRAANDHATTKRTMESSTGSTSSSATASAASTTSEHPTGSINSEHGYSATSSTSDTHSSNPSTVSTGTKSSSSSSSSTGVHSSSTVSSSSVSSTGIKSASSVQSSSSTGPHATPFSSTANTPIPSTTTPITPSSGTVSSTASTSSSPLESSSSIHGSHSPTDDDSTRSTFIFYAQNQTITLMNDQGLTITTIQVPDSCITIKRNVNIGSQSRNATFLSSQQPSWSILVDADESLPNFFSGAWITLPTDISVSSNIIAIWSVNFQFPSESILAGNLFQWSFSAAVYPSTATHIPINLLGVSQTNHPPHLSGTPTAIMNSILPGGLGLGGMDYIGGTSSQQFIQCKSVGGLLLTNSTSTNQPAGTTPSSQSQLIGSIGTGIVSWTTLDGEPLGPNVLKSVGDDTLVSTLITINETTAMKPFQTQLRLISMNQLAAIVSDASTIAVTKL